MGHQWMGASIARRIDLALEIVRAADDERQRLQSLYDVVGAGLAITEAVPAAFGVLALAEGDIHRTAVFGAALSGDADTVTAIACAIAGAWQGIEAFDPSWLEQLRMANPELDFEGVAEGLYQLVRH
ncbi:ADP-ribosylglycohydrolase family protein, partial [Thermanaerothrix sp.]